MNFYELSLILFYERLERKIEYFKNGDELIALDMAVQIRALVHDRPDKSVSLLTHLAQKNIEFIKLTNSNWMKGGISYRKFGDNISNMNYAQLLPFPSNLLGSNHVLENGIIVTTYLPLSFGWKPPLVKTTFADWWNEEVAYLDDSKKFLTRAKIVLGVANKDGGAHYDDKAIPTKKLKSSKLLGVNINENLIETDNYPLYPILCQMAYEILETIKPIYFKLKNNL